MLIPEKNDLLPISHRQISNNFNSQNIIWLNEISVNSILKNKCIKKSEMQVVDEIQNVYYP